MTKFSKHAIVFEIHRHLEHFMNIKEHIRALKAKRGDNSFAFLAERTETSETSPYRIKPAEEIKPEETLVLVLAGSGGRGDNLRGYNGYLKKTHEFIKNHPDLTGADIRVCVAVCNFGQHYDDDIARHEHYMQQIDTQKYNAFIANLPEEHKEEIQHPSYIQDIFKTVIEPRISAADGKIRLSQPKALRNIRRLNIVTHCHGAYVALELEKMMTAKMQQLGYSPKEQKQLKSQLLALNYAPDCTRWISEMRFISIESSVDSHNEYQSYLKEWLQMKPRDFGVCFLPGSSVMGQTFMCTKVDKAGIEGNPKRVYVSQMISGDFFADYAEAKAEAEKNDFKEPEQETCLGEHDFLGFENISNMSRGARQMQLFANNILKNAVINSTQQQENNFVPLPATIRLATDNIKQKYDFAKAAVIGDYLLKRLAFCNRSQIDAYASYRRAHTITLD